MLQGCILLSSGCPSVGGGGQMIISFSRVLLVVSTLLFVHVFVRIYLHQAAKLIVSDNKME
jgi:hypothetical protein